MALTAPLVRILRELQPLLPRGGSLLEIGEANWYGDIDPEIIYSLYSQFSTTPLASSLPGTIAVRDFFAIAKAFYDALFAPDRIVAIDFNGTPEALRHDLNQPLNLTEKRGQFCSPVFGYQDNFQPQRFDVVLNNGTAEHIFNIGQVFRTIHDHCEVGGLMIHDCPFTGWIDHGFYTLQPGLFYDLAAANGYEVVRVYLTELRSNMVILVEGRDHIPVLAETGKIPMGASLVVVLRKLVAGAFRLPMQGYYSGRLSEAGNKAWSEMR